MKSKTQSWDVDSKNKKNSECYMIFLDLSLPPKELCLNAKEIIKSKITIKLQIPIWTWGAKC